MLQSLLKMTGHHYIGPVTLDNLVAAVDRGNIHFVRLLLKLNGQSSDFKPNMGAYCLGFGNTKYVFRYPGIDVDMLKLLKEMGALGIGLCSRLLEHCITNGRVDSVQYILEEVAKEFDDQQRCVIDRAVQSGIVKQTTLGHLDILQSLLRMAPRNAPAYAYGRNLSRVAADNGHMHIIEHLHKNNIGNDTLTFEEEAIVMELMSTHCGERWDLALVSRVIYKTPLDELIAALKRNDQRTAMDILDNHWDNGLSSIVWSHLSELTIAFLSIHKSSHPHDISPNGLYIVVKHIINGKLTLEHGLEYLRMANIVDSAESGDFEHSLKRTSMEWAAGMSLALLQRIRDVTSLSYNDRCLEAAIEHDCLDVISYLLSNNLIDADNLKIWTPELLFTKGSVDAIKIIHQHVKLNIPHLSINAIKNTVDMFKHVMQHIHPPSSWSPRLLRAIINEAVVQDKVDHLKLLIDITHSPVPTPLLDTLIEATKKNAVSTLEYILVKINPPPLTRLPEIDQLRVLQYIMHSAYNYGYTRIITICNDIIKDIDTTIPNIRMNFADLHMNDILQKPSDTSAKSVIYSVLGNNKLNSIIMEHVGWINRSCLGFEDSLIIKGGQLFGNNTLLDFIKYGATEYFIKSFKSINLKHSYPPNNNKLISAAIAHFTPRHIPILDVLLAHPSMLLLEPETINWRQFINQLSDCNTHNWSRIIEDVMKLVMINSNAPPMTLMEPDLFLIKTPLFLSKLLSLGVAFAVAPINAHSPIPPPVSGVLTKWLQCPSKSILEMIQLMRPSLSKDTAIHVLAHSIRMDIQPVSQYIIDRYRLLNDPRLPAVCAKHGYFELYNILPQSTDNSRIMFDTIMERDNCLMPLDIATKTYQHLLDNGSKPTINFSVNVPGALMHCRNKVDLLLSLPHTQGNPNKLVRINNIHPKMISVGLLERLLADPRFQCDFDFVMSSAIDAGDRQVIEMLEANTDNRFKTHYKSAFNTAASVGDLDTIKMILDKRNLSTNTSNSFDTFKYVSTNMMEKYQADGRMLPIEPLLSLFVEYFKRGDIEAIELLKQQSIDCNQKDPNQWAFNGRFGIHSLLGSNMTPITNSKVLTHFIDKGYLDMVNKQHYLTRVIEHACENGNVDIIRLVHNRFTSTDQTTSFIPNTQCIARAVERNQQSVIQYLFGDDQSPIKRSPDATLVVRMANYARHSAFVKGNINIINFCDTIIV
ncbi:hypothetical protein SAMD00019534_098430 [Acytostelium subglobosum LB1]|uniref:hypothetical protein n=1 Tax=Acytostelium subglobosum LB1 TaxID=1410327 RepID=UPI000644F5E6|nr:hypothetical protein SAMD00019534_098430 [Acytostelium subglobosum LB1]GAM26668.1 hypothetical protein SAMD00019534_098430 [Acytostelium subglobosum LB1]|eukprot:XP_012750329.1 hypothetical protein SAMD00019534_098430 [Acytostelium subglobosum LB1]